jgi:hypothetical protein
MPILKWSEDRDFEMVANPTFEEVEVVERQMKAGWDTLSAVGVTRAHVLITLRRQGIILRWKDFGPMALGVDFDIVKTAEELADEEAAAAEDDEVEVGSVPTPAVPVGAAVSPDVETGTG